MSEQADIICLKTPLGWKHSHQKSSGSRKSNRTFYSFPNVKNRRQTKKLLVIRNQLPQNRRDHRHRIFVTFPLQLKLNFHRLRRRGNSQSTSHTGATKAYFCSVQKRSISEAGSNTGIDIHKFKQKMANTLSVMTNVLRNVVSKQRIRYKEKGFNLDLAYVCDNIIAMGYPAEKYESMYRNRLEDVYKFLEENHGDHYKIYNLCLERSYDINKFHGRVSVYPFEDHNPPTIELILKFCEDVDGWLKADNLNVAAVHCKAGKGRTGTMICCYLLFSGQQRTAEDALSCYDEKRTKDRKGVTIPSQRRYVQYFSKLLRLGMPYERRTLQFCEIRFSEPNAMQCFGIVHCSISVLQDTGCAVKVQPLQSLLIDFRKTCVLDMKNPPFSVSGDIKVELTKNSKKVLHFWFNTFFVTDAAVIEGEGNDVKFVYTLHKLEIDDAHKDKEHKYFSEDFKVDLVFAFDENNVERDQMQMSSNNRLTSTNNQRSTSQCTATSLRLPPPASAAAAATVTTTNANPYSLPQNNSSGSEMNFLCDQKSSSSASVSSSLGGGVTTDNSNGFELNVQQRSTQLRNSDVPPQQHFTNSHHSHCFAAMQDASSLAFTSPPPAPQPPVMAIQQTPPGFMMELQYQQHQHQLHKNNAHPMQHAGKGSACASATSTPNHRHILPRQCNARAGCAGNSDDTLPQVDDTSRQPSGSLNATSSNTSYNHSTDSSKTSSVSSQSSSAIGDTEEDWESAKANVPRANPPVTAVKTKPSCVANSSKDVIQKKPPPTPPPRQMQQKLTNPGNKFHIGRTTSNKVKYNHQRNSKQQKCNGLKDCGGDIVTKQNSSNINTIPNATTSTGSNANASTTTSQELCHSCLPASDLTSELQCC